MARADPYADIDFDDVTEATGLAMDEIKCLKVWCSSRGRCDNPIPIEGRLSPPPSWVFGHISKKYLFRAVTIFTTQCLFFRLFISHNAKNLYLDPFQ